MPSYVVTSDGPIRVRELNRPEMPDWSPEHPWEPGPGFPRPPEGWTPPTLPPREDWPPLPPWLQPGVGLPIPPSPEHPMVPVEPPEGGGEDGEEGIWPPIRPEFPDLGGYTLALALVYVSRHVAKWHWVVIDHEKAKERFKEAYEKIKDKLPAGGVGGTPPARPTPGPIPPREPKS